MNNFWTITFKGKLPSPNRNLHWTKRMQTNKKYEMYIKQKYHDDKPALTLPAHIQLIRVAPRQYDFDNLAYSFKGIRDSIASLFFPEKLRGMADNSNHLTWEYLQKKGGVKEYGVEINIVTKE